MNASVADYLGVANQLYTDPVLERKLSAAAARLPLLDRDLLETLATRARQASLDQPRYGWAIATVVDAAAVRVPNRFVQPLAAWHLGSAANAWVRPDYALEALRRARHNFITLDEPGWVAACDWQTNALPWTRNFGTAVAELTQALQGLRQAGFDHFVPHCRLALGYAQSLVADFDLAVENINASEADFVARHDRLNHARCRVIRAGSLRRQARFDEAIEDLNRAQADLEQLDDPVDAAIAHYQLAYCYYLSRGDSQSAQAHFSQAIALFDHLDLPIWLAQAYNGLAQVYNNSGQLSAAAQMLTLVGDLYAAHPVDGPYADYLIDHGKFQVFLGKAALGLREFEQAELIYDRLGSPVMSAVAAMYRGAVCRQLGRHQQALHHLERAQACFEAYREPNRLAECARQLAQTWLEVGRPEAAHTCLDTATTYYQQTGQLIFLAAVYNSRAKAFFYENKGAEAIHFLEEALAVSQQQTARPQIALAQRLLGEALCTLDRPKEAVDHLGTAAHEFADMGMVLEQATCLAALGTFHSLMSDRRAAHSPWQSAHDLSQGVITDTDWQAWAGLAQLSEAVDDNSGALQAYQQMLAALAQLRHSVWKPSLAGSYLQRPAPMLDRAVLFAAHVAAPFDALRFVEESKAQTVARQLSSVRSSTQAAPASEMGQIEAELRWLYEHLRVSFESTRRWRTSEERHLMQPLRQTKKHYEAVREQLERTVLPEEWSGASRDGFDLTQLRSMAGARLGQAWLALDYYLTDSKVCCVTVSDTDCQLWQRALTSRAHFAMSMCAQAANGRGYPTLEDLKALADLLIPESLRQRLTPDTYLLIAPHRQLHQVPWAALPIDQLQAYLVDVCTPVVVPSFQNLCWLWLRDQDDRTAHRDGLILGVSEFGNRRPALPQVRQEVSALQSYLGPSSQYLLDTDATWSNLLDMKHADGLRRFRFLHIASHAFQESITGRLRGVALYDQDLWLDQWWELAPLPGLVTLSACNSIQSLVHEGDEPVGVTSTCLAAGARHVVGSLWPVLDKDAAHLLLEFYEHFLSGQSAAQALALAQRTQKVVKGSIRWESFLCMGSP